MGTHLEIEPGYERILAEAGLRTFDDFLNAKAGPPVSKHRHRETVPLDLTVEGKTKRFFLKRVFRVPPSHVIWPLIGMRKPRSQPAHEWRICDAMKKAGLPAMERVAVGERRVFGVPIQGFILVAASPYRHTLDEWLTPGFERPRPLSADQRMALLRELALLGKRIGDARFSWPDAGAKHIFAEYVGVEGEHKWAFCLIDLERAGYRTKPEEYREAINWQILHSMNPLRISDVEVTMICEAIGKKVEEFKSDIESAVILGEGTLLSDGLRLAHDFVHPRRMHMRKINDIHVSPNFESALQRAGIESIDSVFSLQSGTSLTKPGLATHRDRVRMELEHGGHTRRPAYLKRFRRAPLKEQLRRIWNGGFKRSHARMESRFARRLSEAGIGTLATIAWGQEMRGGWESRSFLITDEVPGESLEKVVGRIEKRQLTVSATEKFEVIRQLAMITRRMHGEGLFHRDLYLCHIFLSREPDGRPFLRVIDLGRMINSCMECVRWTIKDLAALDYSSPKSVVTRADRARFLYHYLTGSVVHSRLPEMYRGAFSLIKGKVERRNRKTAAHDAKRTARHKRSQTAT